MPDPGDDLALLIAAARRAGEIAMAHFRHEPEVWVKKDDSPVTEADIAIDRVLRTDLRAARPSYGWLSEETEDDGARLNAESLFVVDPIDGTRAFVDGQTSFAHALAVVRDGEVTAGVVYLPAKDKLYAAARGKGATLNGAPIRASDPVAETGATLLATRPMMQPAQWRGGVPEVVRVYRPSLAYRLALVAEGRFDGMITFRDSWEWDIAAGALLAREAGAMVSDGTGASLRFNSPTAQQAGIMVAGPSLHRRLLSHRLGT